MEHAHDLAELPPLAELFSAYSRFAWRVLRRHGVPEAELDDALQEVFLVVHRRRAEVYADVRVTSWIYGICVRVAARTRSKAGRRREHPSADPGSAALAPHADPGERTERRQALAKLEEVLTKLPIDQREVFVLHEIEQLSVREIAEALGTPEGTLHSRLHAARGHVRRAFARLGYREVSR